MRLSAFITITNPEARGDNYNECRTMAKDLCDEVVVVDGKNTWPQEFSWPIIGKHFQKGYEQATGDWVTHLDCDFIFHEKNFDEIRQALMDYPTAPAISFYKYQFIQPDRYNIKSRLALVVNKGKFKDRIKFDGGGESDLCQPSLDGKLIDMNNIPEAGVPFYNYEHISKTEAQVRDDIGRMDRAYFRHYGKWLYSLDGSEESAFNGWIKMVVGRASKPSKNISLDEHPRYMQDLIRNLRPDQFGHSGFGNFEVNDYANN